MFCIIYLESSPSKGISNEASEEEGVTTREYILI